MAVTIMERTRAYENRSCQTTLPSLLCEDYFFLRVFVKVIGSAQLMLISVPMAHQSCRSYILPGKPFNTFDFVFFVTELFGSSETIESQSIESIVNRVNSRDKTAAKTTSLPVYFSHEKRSSEPHSHQYSAQSSGSILLSPRSDTDAAVQPTEEATENRNPVPRHPSLCSLANFADTLVASSGADPPFSGEFPLEATEVDSCKSNDLSETKSSRGVQESCSQSSLVQDEPRPARPPLPAKKSTLAAGSVLTRSTPNLDEGKHGSMVTKTSPMYSYLHNGSSHASQTPNSSKMKPGRYWEGGQQDTPGREDYAHHLRSSSYQVLHSQHQQLNIGASYHARQHSNPSSYPDTDDRNSRLDMKHSNNSSNNNYHYYGQQNSDRSRYFSYDSIGPESGGHKYQTSWNVSEPDLSVSNSQSSHNSHYHHSPSQNSFNNSYTQLDHHSNSLHSSPSLHKSVSRSHSSNFHQSPSNGMYDTQSPPPPPPLRHSQSSTSKNPSSPPPPPVRDASSLKYIKYGPGHEKFPSWPVPAGSANQVINSVSKPDSASQTLSESLTGPQGSHRSKSWTEQSDYPKDSSGGYTRPHHKKQLTAAYQQQLKTVMEKCERIPPQVFESKFGDDLMSNPNCSLIDSFYQSKSPYYPLFDRDGHGIDDKDYNIPSPPERDPGPSLGEANLSQVTAAQLEEYARHYDYSCSDTVGVTPLLDQLREESAGWDGSSERDSGRGESESMADSFRYSNGRESVTTVVTNSSSASSSETLKWHGSLSDISLMSGHSRDTRTEQNIAHSSRVLAPQRHNSESVLYYGTEKSKKSRPGPDHRANGSGKNSRESDSGFLRGSRDRWNREVERNNEVNNLKKFPSYSYSQPLSQINEAPAAESHENHSVAHHATSPTIDMSKPPSVAERISELERQSRNPVRESMQRYRDASEPRERTESRCMRELRRRDMSEPRKEIREDSQPKSDSDQNNYPDLGYSTPDPDSQLREQSESSDPTKDDLTLDSSRDTGSFRANMTQVSSNNDLAIHDQENNTLSNTSNSEIERTPPLKNLSYLYPGKQGEVSEPTLKNIQKQALLSFYVRKTSSSALGEQHGTYFGKPPASLVSKNSFSSRGHVREDRSGLAGVSLARLGRVPADGDKDSPSRPPRKRSVTGRSDLDASAPLRENIELHRPRAGSESSGSNSATGQSVSIPVKP
ncbi:hypothetical protein FHG87_007127 [Trinorchestia longiramus]|nr:hypothetical protein FHG87_007127 [Trinorchestia longiramus]